MEFFSEDFRSLMPLQPALIRGAAQHSLLRSFGSFHPRARTHFPGKIKLLCAISPLYLTHAQNALYLDYKEKLAVNLELT